MCNYAKVSFEPVNVAKPEWACPHCGHNYRSDKHRAQECADLGPAPAVESEPIVLDLRSGYGHGDPALDIARPGPVRADHRNGRHVQDFAVGRKTVSSDHLDPALGPDSVHILVSGHRGEGGIVTTKTRSGPSGYKALEKFFGFTDSFGDRTDVFWPSLGFSVREDPVWLRQPSDAERNVIVTLMPKTAERLDAATPESLVDGWRDTIRRRGTAFRTHGDTLRFVPDPSVIGSVATAHGFGPKDDHGKIRWANRHYDTILEWLACSWLDWWAGADIVVPDPDLRPESLPKSPGKKRMSVFSPFLPDGADTDKGDDRTYFVVARAVTGTLTVPFADVPANPVPGVPDASTFYQGA